MTGGMFHGVSRGHVDDEVFGSVYDHHVVMRMFPYILPYKRMATIAFLSMLVFTGTLVAVPWIIKWAIDGYIVGDGEFSGLTLIFILFLVVAVLNWGSNYLQQLAMAKVGQRILYGLRGDMFRHLQNLSVGYYDKTAVGRLMSRVQGDTGQLQEFMSLVVMTLGDLLACSWTEQLERP